MFRKQPSYKEYKTIIYPAKRVTKSHFVMIQIYLLQIKFLGFLGIIIARKLVNSGIAS